MPTVPTSRKRKPKKQRQMEAEIIGFWSSDSVVHLLLRTLHMALAGQIGFRGMAAAAAAVVPEPGGGLAARGEGPGPAASATISESDGVGGGGAALLAASICKCLLELQLLLVDRKPVGGWKSDALKTLREAVVRKLRFR